MTKITRIESTEHAKNKKLRVAAYCRVSTSTDSQLESLAVQKAHYTQVISQNENWEFAGIYYDEGITGTKKDVRPELLRLLEDCKAGTIELILVKSISRFSRNTADCLEMIRTLTSYKVGIFFERENINTLEMEDEFLLTVLGSLAENESRSISENEKWSIRKRFLKGTFRQGLAPYGFYMDDGELKIDETTAPVIRFIFDEACSGKGVHKIAKELNLRGIPPMKATRWGKESVKAILHNERYVGDALYQKTYSDGNYMRHINNGEYDQVLHQNHHDAIISREQFEMVQSMIAYHREERGIDSGAQKYQEKYVFTGKLLCNECGSTFRRVIQKGRVGGDYILWACATHRKNVDDCSMKAIPEENIMAAFITVTNKLIFSKRQLLEPFVKATQNICSSEIDEQIREIDLKLDANEEKAQMLTTLLSSNLLDSGMHKKAQAALTVENTELKSRKAALASRVQTANKGVSEGSKLLKRIQGMEISETFDEAFFLEFIKAVHIYSRQEFGFEFTCGIVLREAVTMK